MNTFILPKGSELYYGSKQSILEYKEYPISINDEILGFGDLEYANNLIETAPDSLPVQFAFGYDKKKHRKYNRLIANRLYDHSGIMAFLTNKDLVIHRGFMKHTRKNPTIDGYTSDDGSGYYFFDYPSILNRNYDDENDSNHGLNRIGIFEEYRIYKLASINGIHRSFCFEHSNWSALNALELKIKHEKSINELGIKIPSKDIMYVLGGFLHDIGKIGVCCSKTRSYEDWNPLRLNISFCHEMKEYGGYVYQLVPEHQVRGYRYLTSNDPSEQLIRKSNGKPISRPEWDMYLSQYLNKKEQKMIRVSIASHYIFGVTILDSMIRGGLSYSVFQNFFDTIEMYYNSEGLKDCFVEVVIFCTIISASDILGQKYNKNLPDSYGNIKNLPPNFLMKSGKANIDDLKNFIEANPVDDLLLNFLYENFIPIIELIVIMARDRQPEPKINYKTMNIFYQIGPPDNLLPRLIVIDLDRTLLYTQYTPHMKYHLIPTILELKDYFNKLREQGVKVTIASRHAYPKTFSDFFNSNQDIQFFDAGIVKYSGEDLKKKKGWKPSIEGYNHEFIFPEELGKSTGYMWNKDNKEDHVTYLMKELGIDSKRDVVVFDDKLDAIESTFLALSPNYNMRSKDPDFLTLKLVRQAIAIYSFWKNL